MNIRNVSEGILTQAKPANHLFVEHAAGIIENPI
jgi:hypothetical protein